MKVFRIVRREDGQGTVEYVGLVLLIGVILTGVVTAASGFDNKKSIPNAVVQKLEHAIKGVGKEGPK